VLVASTINTLETRYTNAPSVELQRMVEDHMPSATTPKKRLAIGRFPANLEFLVQMQNQPAEPVKSGVYQGGLRCVDSVSIPDANFQNHAIYIFVPRFVLDRLQI
jgi:hypothetical protein